MRFREGRERDLRDTFLVQRHGFHHVAVQIGAAEGPPPPDEELEQEWSAAKPLFEFLAAQDGCYWVCEDDEGIVGYARTVRFEAMEELTELFVEHEHHGEGVGRELIHRCWPEPPTPELGRIVVAAGTNVDLSLHTTFGTMPVAGHWHMRQATSAYLEHRAQETDTAETAVHVLKDGAVTEWNRLEPASIGHDRPALHEFFGRERTCLATLDGGTATGLCWVSRDGDIGPAVGVNAEALVPLVLAALDRVAKTQEPEHLSVFCTTESWWLLRRLRELGFRLHWPSWIMSSVPLPGLDRYVPTHPAWVL